MSGSSAKAKVDSDRNSAFKPEVRKKKLRCFFRVAFISGTHTKTNFRTASSFSCERLERPGYKHKPSAVLGIATSGDLEECSRFCRRANSEIACKSFSFKVNSAIDNCVISDLDLGGGRVLDKLLVDARWDLYEAVDGRECGEYGEGIEGAFETFKTFALFGTLNKETKN